MNISNICYSSTYPTARLAILQNDDALFSSFVSSYATDLWFDAQRSWIGSSWSYTYNSFYTPGYSKEQFVQNPSKINLLFINKKIPSDEFLKKTGK
jgi:hypothetical protein